MIGADYYNDHDPGAVAWLEALAAAGEIPPGKVDSRSILDVRANELSGFRRVHFFAGIGGWAEALRIARWPADLQVWTGSPPCQPFSVAGKLNGRDDDRHLAPHFASVVWAGRPLLLFGEQVASADVLGRTAGAARGAPAWAWSDDLQDRLEAAGYAYGAADLCSAGIGAPHIRQRLFFGAFRRDALAWIAGRLADHYGDGWCEAGCGIDAGGVVDAQRARLEGLAGHGARGGEPGRQHANEDRPAAEAGAAGIGHNRPGPLHGFWRDADWLFCRDERWRPVEPIDERMAYGVSIALDPSIIGIVDAATSEGIVSEAMRAMREGYDPAAIWAEVGRCVGFPAASILLAVLCQHTGELGQVQHRWPTSGQKDRIARHLQQVWLQFGSIAGPPSGRGFSEQLARQLGNSLPKLPLKGAPPRWRALTMLTAGPLAENVSGRVGILRGYGNAINPWLAAAFIEAFARSIIDIGGEHA